MAGSKRPSFLKRQKEQQRLARATEKREARRARKHAKSLARTAEGEAAEGDGADMLMDPPVGDEGAENGGEATI